MPILDPFCNNTSSLLPSSALLNACNFAMNRAIMYYTSLFRDVLEAEVSALKEELTRMELEHCEQCDFIRCDSTVKLKAYNLV